MARYDERIYWVCHKQFWLSWRLSPTASISMCNSCAISAIFLVSSMSILCLIRPDGYWQCQVVWPLCRAGDGDLSRTISATLAIACKHAGVEEMMDLLWFRAFPALSWISVFSYKQDALSIVRMNWEALTAFEVVNHYSYQIWYESF